MVSLINFLTQGEKIRLIRKKLNIKQQELEAAGITRNFISMVESGKRHLNKNTAKNITNIFLDKACEMGIELDIDDEYLYRAPKDDAKLYCINKIENCENIDEMDKLAAIADNYSISEIYPDIFSKRADISYKKGNYNEAFVYYYNAIECCIEIGEESKKAYLYNCLGKCRLKKNDCFEALQFFDKAYNFSLEADDNESVKSSLYNISLCYMEIQNIDSALSYIEKFIEACVVTSKDFSDYVKGIILKADCYIKMGYNNKAIGLYNDLEHMSQDMDDKILSCIYDNLAIIYFDMGKLRKAIECIDRAINIKIQIEDEKLPSSLINKARIYFEQELIDKAADTAYRAINIAKKQESRHLILEAYNLLEKIYSANDEKLEELYINEISELKKQKNSEELFKTTIKLSLLNINRGNTSLGKELLQKVISAGSIA